MALVSDFNNSIEHKGLTTFRLELAAQIEQKLTFAKLEKAYGVNRYYLWNIIHNPAYVPPVKVLAALGLDVVASVVVIEGTVTAGAQALGETRCQCGRTFISNHPRRVRCFICSPYRKRKAK